MPPDSGARIGKMITLSHDRRNRGVGPAFGCSDIMAGGLWLMQARLIPIPWFPGMALGGGWVDAAVAQTAEKSQPAVADATLSSDMLLGAPVTNAAGDTIGNIDSLILVGRFRVVAAVVDGGGFLGIGARQVE